MRRCFKVLVRVPVACIFWPERLPGSIGPCPRGAVRRKYIASCICECAKVYTFLCKRVQEPERVPRCVCVCKAEHSFMQIVGPSAHSHGQQCRGHFRLRLKDYHSRCRQVQMLQSSGMGRLGGCQWGRWAAASLSSWISRLIPQCAAAGAEDTLTRCRQVSPCPCLTSTFLPCIWLSKIARSQAQAEQVAACRLQAELPESFC